MKRDISEFRGKLWYVIEHTIVLALVITSIAGIRYILSHLIGSDAKFFDIVSVRYFTDFAQVLAITTYLFVSMRAFRRTDKGNNLAPYKVTEAKSSAAEVIAKPQAPVVRSLASYKTKRLGFAGAVLLTTVIIYAILSRSQDFQLDTLFTGTLLVVGLALLINFRTLSYRIDNGLYGTNEYEAREIIHFMIENSDKYDFTDSDGLQQVFPQVFQVRDIDTALGIDIGEVEG